MTSQALQMKQMDLGVPHPGKATVPSTETGGRLAAACMTGAGAVLLFGFRTPLGGGKQLALACTLIPCTMPRE